MKQSIFTFRQMSHALAALSLLVSTVAPGLSRALVAAPTLDNSEEIVYIDNKGSADTGDDRIRVFDPTQTGGAIKVTWESQDAGIFDFTLGDVNNDTDMEVIAIRSLANNTGEVIVYDPVVAFGASDGNSPEGIPYKRLARIPLTGSPSVIAAGNFDSGVDGAEILVGFALNSNDSRIEIYKGTAKVHDGSSWVRHISKDYAGNIWRDASVGDLMLGGTEEVALIAPITGNMFVAQPDQGFRDICKYEAAGAKPFDVAIGQWIAGGRAEVAIVREFPADGTISFPRFLVFGCKQDATGDREDVDVTNEQFRFNPPPFNLFTADVNANQDDEFFMLRTLSVDQPSSPHLIGRNGGSDTLDFEVRLDANDYKAGAGGDVDGDGKDEVVVIRDNKLRIYTDPEIGTTAKDKYSDFGLNTNSFAVEIGDLDKKGFQIGYVLTSTPDKLSTSVAAGDRRNDAGLFAINTSGNVNKPFQILRVEGIPADVKLLFREIGDLTPGQTPANMLFDVDATTFSNPRPNEPYKGFVVVGSSDAEVKGELKIEISVTVGNARLESLPSSTSFVYFPCTDTLEALTETVQIVGSKDISFTVLTSVASSAGVDAPDLAAWVTVNPKAGKTGDTLTLNFDPSKWSRNVEATSFFVLGDEKVGATPGERLREVKVVAFCATTRQYLSIIGR